MLPQDVSTVFIKNTVRDDLFDICRAVGCSKDEAEKKIAEICGELSITEVLSRHPYDLSGGEAQRAALAKVLLTEPEILLLDEPTKAVDACAKRVLTGILRRLAGSGVTVFAATHDTEFAAEISDRCAMLFDGSVICPSCPQVFSAKTIFIPRRQAVFQGEYLKTPSRRNRSSLSEKERTNERDKENSARGNTSFCRAGGNCHRDGCGGKQSLRMAFRMRRAYCVRAVFHRL